MSRRARAKARTLLSEFSRRLGSQTLNVRIYRNREAFACERELVERDGTSFTMVVPFTEPAALREALTADPYYPQMRGEVGHALAKLERALREQDEKAAA